MGAYAKEVLVDADWLQEHTDDPAVRILEVDEDTEAYAKGHIRNAVGVHWQVDLQDPVRRDFIGPERFASLANELGIAGDTLVVLYGGNNNWFAAYAYWYFKVYGHEKVVLLNGGRKRWELDSRELTQTLPEIAPSVGYRTAAPDTQIRALRDYVLGEVARNPQIGLVDVRSPEEYRGELLAPAHLPQEAAQRGGHIPGAANIPWSRSVNADTGEFLDVDALRALYIGNEITPEKEIVAYCRIGERSAHTWFVLHELLGYPKVRNYDGSWTEYGSLVGVPIER